tara:strand:+ start:5707 stop:6750 length:1044 start_codon:yes stop_codon:yes gene_type:complete
MIEENSHQTINCSNPECKIEETGRCVEGIEPKDCPHYNSEASYEVSESQEESLENNSTLHRTELSPSEALSLSTASNVLQNDDSRVICILGPSDSGKTCLIASIYDMFQTWEKSGMEFRHSRSLLAFEKICHDARSESKRGTPHSQRTPLGEVHFYHLNLCILDNPANISLLIADRAGEEYKSASDDISIVDEFVEVHRADTINVLVDGERLIDNAARHNLKIDIAMMLQALKDHAGIKSKPQLAIVLTKFDAVQESTNECRTLSDFDKIRVDLAARLKNYVSSIETFKVAASPKAGNLPRAEGVSSLLKYWLNSEIQKPSIILDEIPRKRYFDRLVVAVESEEHDA